MIDLDDVEAKTCGGHAFGLTSAETVAILRELRAARKIVELVHDGGCCEDAYGAGTPPNTEECRAALAAYDEACK